MKYAQKCKRPLLSSAGDLLRYIGIYHKGVVVTLENDERWLIHKVFHQLTNVFIFQENAIKFQDIIALTIMYFKMHKVGKV